MIPLGSAGAGVLLDYLGRVPTTLVFAAVMAIAATIASVSGYTSAIPRTTELDAVETLV